MKPVQIVKVSKIIPIYKEGVEANSINVINFDFLNGDECGYNVIAQKGLYELGDPAIYIMPDYCLSEIALFESFTAPNGEPNKSKLGKMNRIRAIKFNFNFDNSTDPIFSFGIMLPISEVKAYLGEHYNEENLTELLGITKYEEPETAGSGQAKGDFPSFLYGTDETNQETLKGRITKLCNGETEMGFAIKRDGSSFTGYFKKNENNDWIHGICSRSQEKKTEQYYVSKYVDDQRNEYTKYLHPSTKEMGWYCSTLSTFFKDDEIESKGFKKITTEVKDSWVELANSSGLVSKGMEYCQQHDVQLAFRGEIYGQGLKGSGNKYNPDATKKQGLYLFGVDNLETGFSVRNHYGNEHNLEKIALELGIEYSVSEWHKPASYEEFCQICEGIIKKEQAAGRVIEGVVVRTKYSNELSTKYMSSLYDSKK